MSLLQGVLRSNTEDLERKLSKAAITQPKARRLSNDDDSDEDKLINVMSLPGSPSRTRPSSPTRGSAASSRPIRGPLLLSSSKTDPLKAFPTEVSQRIFACLSIKQLARCALVCKKWSRSQTLNYIWFQHYRRENFDDSSLTPGKWTRRESKQNWRQVHLKSSRDRDQTHVPGAALFKTPGNSGYASPHRSGALTPKEVREEQWKQEAEGTSGKPDKEMMRVLYKELGGRKSRGKTKLASTGVRDRGGWNDQGGEEPW